MNTMQCIPSNRMKRQQKARRIDAMQRFSCWCIIGASILYSLYNLV